MANTKNLSILTDTSLMPFGQFKNYEMANVPFWHLLWLHYEQNEYTTAMRKQYSEVFLYIEENLDSLLNEEKQNNKKYSKDVDTSSMFNS